MCTITGREDNHNTEHIQVRKSTYVEIETFSSTESETFEPMKLYIVLTWLTKYSTNPLTASADRGELEVEKNTKGFKTLRGKGSDSRINLEKRR
jgi:hypothetical protein